MSSDGRARVLFVGNTSYQLPLPPGLAKKWDHLSERMDVRVIGRAGACRGQDARFRLLAARGPAFAASFHAALPVVVPEEVRRFRPHVVIAQSPFEALPILASGPLLRPRPKIVVEIHGDWRTAPRVYGSRLRRLYAPLADRAALVALRRADATRSLSPFTDRLAEEARGRPSIASFPTFTDLESFLADPIRPVPDRPGIAWVGMFQNYKNPTVMAQAWGSVAERVPEAQLTLVGDGPLSAIAQQLVRDFPDRVRWRPQLAPGEVAGVLDDSRALALPSWSEGMPRVAIEAFSRGRGVVGSTAGGIPDIVKPERNGLLVPPGDPDALTHALVRVLEDRELAQRFGAAAAEDAGEFQWPPARYADAVSEMVERARALP